jgi:hypothetical protein
MIAIALIIVGSATSVTITRVSKAQYGGYFISAYYENQNPPVTGCTLPCLTVDTQITQPASSNSFTLASGGSMYLWSPQFAGSTTINAGTWGLDFWATGLDYVPVTITNNQGAATPNPFQVRITWNPSTYSGYEASNLGNVRFCSDIACTTMLNGWLESCTPSCSTSATSASAWVKLTSAISASGGTLTIYMVFLSSATAFDGSHWGEAPSLSGTYGQYDNGANVFAFYDNFAGTSLSGKWTKIASASGVTFTVNNGLTVATSTTGAYGFVISAYQAYPEVAETYTLSGNSILGVSTSQAVNNFIAPYSGYSMDWYLNYDDIEAEGATSTQMAAPTEATFPTGIWQVTWSATGTEYFLDGKGVGYTGANAGNTIANYGIYVGQSNGVIGGSVFSWARTRAFPPSNVMPSVSLGTLTSNKVSVSAYITGSTGAVVATVANNIQSPALGTASAQYGMNFAGSQVTIPASGYISIVVTASADSCTFFWGGGQPTNFQVSYTFKST